jgi:hypothetical protein
VNARLVVTLCTAAVFGCAAPPTAVETPRRFVAIGATNATFWADSSVPGSVQSRAGAQLPLYFVCEVPDDASARAAAVLSEAAIALYENGTAQLHLTVGTWMRREGTVSSSGETISRQGNWSENAAGLVTLNGFNLPGLGEALRFTALGNAELTLSMACPGGTSVAHLTPTLSLSRTH